MRSSMAQQIIRGCSSKRCSQMQNKILYMKGRRPSGRRPFCIFGGERRYLFGTLLPRQFWISWWIGFMGRSWAFSAISLPSWAIWAWNFLNWNGSAPSFSFSPALPGHCSLSAWWSVPLSAASNTPPAGAISSSAG